MVKIPGRPSHLYLPWTQKRSHVGGIQVIGGFRAIAGLSQLVHSQSSSAGEAVGLVSAIVDMQQSSSQNTGRTKSALSVGPLPGALNP